MAKKLATLRKSIASVALAATTVGERTHNLGVDILEYVQAHGDTTPASEMVDALKGTGIYRKALIDWFKKHGFMETKLNNGGGITFVKREGADFKKINLDAAKADFFGKKDTDRDATAPTLDVFQLLAGVLKREDKITEAKDKGENVEIVSMLDDEDRALITAMMPKYQGAHEAHKAARKAA